MTQRELKFRAWNTAYEEMRYFTHMISDGNAVGFCEPDDGYVDLGSMDDEAVPVMQATGLKDANGREIYEDDIVRYGPMTAGHGVVEWYRGRVVWANTRGSWCIRARSEDFDDTKTVTLTKKPNLLIVSNIHENPELLTEAAPDA